MLIRDGWSCVKGAGHAFPLWRPDSHIDYMLAADYSDLILASDNVGSLLEIGNNSNINMIAAVGWSGVFDIVRLFEFGYSKVFLGGSDRSLPTHQEAKYFAEMVHIYGASSFGYSLHWKDELPDLGREFLLQFNEILVIPEKLQLIEDVVESALLANTFAGQFGEIKNVINLCAPAVNHGAWISASEQPVNYVNYCEHAIARLR